MRIKFIEHAWRYGTENTLKVAYNDAVAIAMRWRRVSKERSIRFEEEHPKLSHAIDYVVGGIIGTVLALPTSCLIAGVPCAEVWVIIRTQMPFLRP